MTKSKKISFFALLLICFAISLTITGCSKDSKAKPEGDMKDTEYCKKYKEFEEKVATDSFEKQLKKLEAVKATKDFPDELEEDYVLVIEGYKKTLNNEPISKEEKKYEAAVKKISRHAINHCDTLESNSGANSGF